MEKYKESQPLEDRALKEAAQLFGEELMPMLGIRGKMKRMAPTEQVYLNPKDFIQDFNYEMEDGSWVHLEFESDSIKVSDLRRFRTYESIISQYYKVAVVTCVVCSSDVQELKDHLTEGINTYHIKVLRLKDEDADETICQLKQLQRGAGLKRPDLLKLLLLPLMSGKISQSERIRQGMKLLREERDNFSRDDLMRMEAVLYTLAMKFLNSSELRELKEMMNMTILGEMLVQDGMEKGIEKGIRALILDYLEDKIPKEQIMKRLQLRFELTEEKAAEYFERFSKEAS